MRNETVRMVGARLGVHRLVVWRCRVTGGYCLEICRRPDGGPGNRCKEIEGYCDQTKADDHAADGVCAELMNSKRWSAACALHFDQPHPIGNHKLVAVGWISVK